MEAMVTQQGSTSKSGYMTGRESWFAPHSGDIEILCCLDAHGRRCIVKRLRPDRGSRTGRAHLRNEQRMLGQLLGVAGCAQLVPDLQSDHELVYEDTGGVPLDAAGRLGAVTLEEFLDLAIRIAEIVASVHARGAIHKDINPANIHIHPETGALELVNFELSSAFVEDHPAFAPPNRIEGTLAYMSPEQTGRVNRAVDYRTDLYSLGATLYALACGRPPFEDVEPMDLLHAHIARRPEPLPSRVPWMPAAVWRVIEALLSKEPEARYQSAGGVVHDLSRLRDAQHAAQDLDSVVLMRHDLALTMRSPRRLHGRDQELAMLMGSMDRVAGGCSQAWFVSGNAGVGKTALIHELHRTLTLRRWTFVSGKHEQYSSDRPMDGLCQALRQISQFVLAEPEAVVRRVRASLLGALGGGAAALTELEPELSLLLGSQPPAASVDPIDSQHRLIGSLARFVRTLAEGDTPLLLFLDDLQWADAPTLDFVEALLSSSNSGRLFFIGAYRDAELDASQALARRMRSAGSAIASTPLIRLQSLRQEHVNNMLADIMGIDPISVSSLSELLRAKTEGNPLHIVTLLAALVREGSVTPEPSAMTWRWDMEAVRRSASTGNMLAMLTGRLARLAPATAHLLFVAACIGSDFDLRRLALACGQDAKEIVNRLLPALEQGLITTTSASQFVGLEPDLPLHFCHDKIQQAAYQSHDEAARMRQHLHIARRFAAARPAGTHGLGAAEHYALAAPLVTDAAERRKVRRLLLESAVVSRKAGAYSRAERLLQVAIGLLDQAAWMRDREGTFRLHAELHLAMFGLARADELERIYAVLEQHAESPLELVDPACSQVVNLSNALRHGEALALIGGLLGQLGMPLPERDIGGLVEMELERFYRLIQNGGLARLSSPTRVTDEVLIGAVKLMSRALTALHRETRELAHWIVLRCACLWLERGYHPSIVSPATCVAYTLIAVRNDYAMAYRVALSFIDAAADAEGCVELGRARCIFSIFAAHWFEPLEQAAVRARAAYEQCMRAGDLEFAGYALVATQLASVDCASSLAAAATEVEAAIAYTTKVGNWHQTQVYEGVRWMLASLGAGVQAEDVGGSDAHGYDEVRNAATPQMLGTAHACRAFSALVFDDVVALERHAASATLLSDAVAGVYTTTYINVADSMALLNRLRIASDDQRQMLMEAVERNQRWLAERAQDMPLNFAHLHALVEAEYLDMKNQPWEALRGFSRAVQMSRDHRRPLHHAIATERAGLFCMRRGLDTEGRRELRRARSLYAAWGADAKVRAMARQWRFPAEDDPGSKREAISSPGAATDAQALVRASQVLAAETDRAQLIGRMVDIVGKLGGATGVVLLLQDDEDGEWYIEASRRADVDPAADLPLRERRRLLPDDPSPDVPVSAFRLGLQTRSPVSSEDAVADPRFALEPYFAGVAMCSLLAVPVLVRSRVSAFLMLENRLTRGAFTRDRVEAVALLGAQLAISIDNAKLYQALERRVQDRADDARELLELNQEVIEHSSIGIVVARPDGKLVQVNAAAARIVGADVDRLLEQNFHALPSWKACGAYDAAMEVLSTGRPMRIQTRLVSSFGNSLQVDWSFSTFASQGETRLLSLIQDVSEASEAAQTLLKAKEMAELAAQTRSAFVANISHEIRTPLNAIIGMSYLALKGELPRRQRDYLQKIQQSGRHLLDVVNEVLDFSKIEEGKLSTEERDFTLDEVFETVMNVVGDRAAAKGLELLLDVGPRVPTELSGDALRLGQILINYATNAVKFTSRGEVVISVHVVEQTARDALLKFQVRDTGIGLSPEQLARLFQPFEQADTSTTRQFGGTGLGLAICKRLAALMGGEVGVQSQEGRGSTFWATVRLRVRSATRSYVLSASGSLSGFPAGQSEVEAMRPPALLGGTRVLLVEDDPLNQQVAFDLLRDAGVHVDVAGDGRAALAQLEAHEYDAVLMDVQMPVMDGLSATRELRRREGHRQLPVIAMTAESVATARERCLDAGMNDCLSKPVDPDELLRVLGRWTAFRPADRSEALLSGDLPSVEGLDTRAGLHYLGDKVDAYLDFLRIFFADEADMPARLREQLRAGDLDHAYRTVHTFKGLAATVGAHTLNRQAIELESVLSPTHDAEAVASALASLERTLVALRAAVFDALPSVRTGTEAASPVRRLLLVDDHPANRLALRTQVESLGWHCIEARDGLEAMTHWKAGGIDAILTDLHMPGIDGHALARAVREHEAATGAPGVPIILVSADSIRTDDPLIQASGIDVCLTRPVEAEALARALTRAVSNAPPGSAPPAAHAKEESALPPAAFSVDALHGMSGDAPDIESSFLLALLESNSRDLEELERHVAANQLGAAASVAHRIAGAARIVKADDVNGSCEAIRAAATAADFPLAKCAVGDLREAMGRFERAARQLLDQQARSKSREAGELLALGNAAIQHAGVGVAIFSDDGACLLANPKAVAIMSAAGDGRESLHLHTGEAWRGCGAHELALAVLHDRIQRRLQCELSPLSGQSVWVEWQLSTFESEGSLRLMALMHNITEYKLAESALSSSDAYHRDLFDLSPRALAVADPLSDEIVDCNAAAARLWGFDGREAVIGLRLLDLSDLVQADGPAAGMHLQRLREAMARGGACFQWHYRRPTGERWSARVDLAFFNHRGRLLMHIAFDDLTSEESAGALLAAMQS